MYFARLKASLDYLLQRTVKFNINGKILREGKIILYNLKDYYIEFVIITKKDQQKIYEIPIPFRISMIEHKVVYDYDTKYAVHSNIDDLINVRILAGNIGKKSKFFNNKLSIEM